MQSDFAVKQKKYMPVFPKATGTATVSLEGYPYEDEEPMPGTGSHSEQGSILYEQFSSYFSGQSYIYVGFDNFVYYRQGDRTKVVAPDVYVVLGAAKYPLRRSFYTWSEGVVPTTVFEFLSESTAAEDRFEKVGIYLDEMGVSEYFLHQPELEKPSEFRGWRRSISGDVVEMLPDESGGLFSAALNLSFRWSVQVDSHVRLLRPYLPDGTPLTTAKEERHLHVEERRLREAAEVRAEAAEVRAEAEAERRQELEVELERLRRQLANR